MLNGGVVGRVFYAKLEWTVDKIPPGERDIVFDLAPHPVDVLNYLLDEWPSSVDAVGESYVRKKELLEEMAFINLEFPDRILANVYLSWIQHGGKDRVVRIVGENGTLFCDALNQTVTLHTPSGPFEVPRSSFPTASSLNGNGSTSHSMGDKTVPNNTIRDMQFQFLDAIEGRGPQLNSSLIGTRNVQVLEAITTSMRARRAGQMHAQPPPVVLRYADGR